MRIQVDMFAVELGAAMLLQFQCADQVVRVLADAGESQHGVNARLQPAAKNFSEEDRDELEIDLLIGTHYDADHLDGLVDIINNEKITIREAWLPPVANDTEPHCFDDVPDDDNLLPLQLNRESGDDTLRSYRKIKAEFCNRIAALERQITEVLENNRDEDRQENGHTVKSDIYESGDDPTDTFFENHTADADKTIGMEGRSHADEQIFDPWDVTDLAELYAQSWIWDLEDLHSHHLSWMAHSLDRSAVVVPALAMIRRAAAKDAINANSLMKVVKALKTRKIPIRCSTISDGLPRRFYWSPSNRRFSSVRAADATGPEILLLGPSNGLVKKHWDRLPIGNYVGMAFYTRHPIKPITPSNQLSYIMVLEHAEQRILISGDAGCVDFKQGRNRGYYQRLLDALAPLHVVQVAHHAGNNAHFYRCLLEAGFSSQQAHAYLLLSHATDDKHRPSPSFTKFVEEVNSNSVGVELLFTSRPLEPKVRDLNPLIGPVIGGSPRNSGDVRLEFSRRCWNVTQHAVKVH